MSNWIALLPKDGGMLRLDEGFASLARRRASDGLAPLSLVPKGLICYLGMAWAMF